MTAPTAPNLLKTPKKTADKSGEGKAKDDQAPVPALVPSYIDVAQSLFDRVRIPGKDLKDLAKKGFILSNAYQLCS